MRPLEEQTVVSRVAEILDIALRRERRDAFADGSLAAQTGLALEGLRELVGGVAAPVAV